MAQADERVLELEQKVRDLEEMFNALQVTLDPSVLGSRQRPVNEIYLKATGVSSIARLTFDDAATPAIKVEKVR